MLMLRSFRVCAAGTAKVNPQPVPASYFQVKAEGTHSPEAARSRGSRSARLAWCAIMDRMRQPPIPFPECTAMVAFLFLFAPAVVWIAVLIMQRFEPRRDQDRGILMARVAGGGRLEPRFSAVNDNAEHQRDPGMLMDRHSISTG
jgi:hypothetical protein